VGLGIGASETKTRAVLDREIGCSAGGFLDDSDRPLGVSCLNSLVRFRTGQNLVENTRT